MPISQVIVAHPSSDGGIEFYSTVARDITERKHAENTVRRHAVLLELLQSVTVQAAEASRLEDALAAAIREVCHRTGWPVGHAFVRAPGEPRTLVSSGIWHIADARFAPLRRATEGAPCPVGRGLPGKAAASRQIEWARDVRGPGERGRTGTAPVVAGYAVPVCVHDQAVAVLEFYHDRVVEADRTLVHVVSQIAERIARVAAREPAVAHGRQVGAAESARE